MTPLFNGADSPQLFGTPLGADFPRALVDALTDAYKNQPPEALARVHLVLNTRRMERRVSELFDEGDALLMPRISLISDLATLDPLSPLPAAEPTLQTKLELSVIIRTLIETEANSHDHTAMAPREAAFDLAESLTALMTEMHEEGVSPEAIAKLDVTDQSGHWQRTQAFLNIVHGYAASRAGLTTAARSRLICEALTARWKAAPPQDPIIIAGSTGSRGLTGALMRAVARLPNGAVVLPGFDFAFAHGAWPKLPEGAMSEDHPQYRFHALLTALDLAPKDVQHWPAGAAPSQRRNTLVSLAMRPAPVTDQWIAEGPEAALIAEKATDGITLVEANTQREEALAIALRLRQAAEDGVQAALITPDRNISRQVTAALARWNITPDDSAGEPLHLSPVGRFLRHVLDVLSPRALTAEALITLLKHPLCNALEERGTHLRYTRELELFIRRKGVPLPDEATLLTWSAAHKDEAARIWAAWVSSAFCTESLTGEQPLETLIANHIATAESLARGPADAETPLWQKDDGIAAQKLFAELTACAPSGGEMSHYDYANLIESTLSTGEVRRSEAVHSGVLIWGTLEARVQGVDLLILAGLNEGSWPEAPAPDPWLNRKMRAEVGLLLPERRIGLSAHDFQQAIAAKEVWLTRAHKSDDAETVPSRWVIRLTNLLAGLPQERGEKALKAIRARAAPWLGRAKLIDAPLAEVAQARRPAPVPPVAMRPRALSITQIQTLIRDPYAIYARHVLKLNSLNPLQKLPDALLRGTILHTVMEEFVKAAKADPSQRSHTALYTLARDILTREVPWPAARLIWLARFASVIDSFLTEEAGRAANSSFLKAEAEGALDLLDIGFTLKGKADRFDILNDGTLAIYDYKTGAPPTEKLRKHFDKQLPLTAVMATEGAFKDIPAETVGKLAYIGLGSNAGEAVLNPEEYDTATVLAEFKKLIMAFSEPDKGYPSRRAIQKEGFAGDYDHLARYGEWSSSDDPVKEVLK
ncbi:double-strand break repair protein AddB [Lentibacter sp. XHP0401]|uniref:double-strand break repair protein AddB n=1 Tax=Lentibacter sp. XHP0401 TaxID=2984334 RepID=UPI0021E8B875|nr:double-strand break repair protein AddB [Lentibacter sp. XHP0401]MCV2892639.1 double-strand break repair protein AddB [Lentibacter sp. XHP0401]